MGNKDASILKQLGEEIRRRRKALNWSQERLAQESNISLKHISEVETGQRNVGVSTLNNIAVALGSNLAEIFTFTLPKEKRPTPELLFEQLNSLLKDNPKLQVEFISRLLEEHKKKL